MTKFEEGEKSKKFRFATLFLLEQIEISRSVETALLSFISRSVAFSFGRNASIEIRLFVNCSYFRLFIRTIYLLSFVCLVIFRGRNECASGF